MKKNICICKDRYPLTRASHAGQRFVAGRRDLTLGNVLSREIIFKLRRKKAFHRNSENGFDVLIGTYPKVTAYLIQNILLTIP